MYFILICIYFCGNIKFYIHWNNNCFHQYILFYILKIAVEIQQILCFDPK